MRPETFDPTGGREVGGKKCDSASCRGCRASKPSKGKQQIGAAVPSGKLSIET